jgi:predicted RNase H-like HicB family nuclease
LSRWPVGSGKQIALTLGATQKLPENRLNELKRRTGGASGGYGEENQTGAQVMRFLIMLEQTETGFAVQAPDLAITTYGENVEAAKRAAGEAIRSNLEAYREAGQQAPEAQSVSAHVENPEFRDLLFAYVDVAEPQGRIAA